MNRELSVQQLEDLAVEMSSNRIRVVRLYCGEETICFKHSEVVARTLAGDHGRTVRVDGSSPVAVVEFMKNFKAMSPSSTDRHHEVIVIDHCDKIPAEMIEICFESARPLHVIIFTARSRDSLPPRLLASCYSPQVAGLNPA